jgi:murein L,D-transpeptidase YcbB/YkuD
MKTKDVTNMHAISKITVLAAYSVLVCAAITFSFKSLFFSITGTENTQDNIELARETLSKSGLGIDEIVKIQTKLNNLGYDAGEADGIFDVKTQDALMKFQISQGLTASGTIDSQTLKILGIYN